MRYVYRYGVVEMPPQCSIAHCSHFDVRLAELFPYTSAAPHAPNSYESMRRQTNETGQRLFAALTNTSKPPKYGNCLIFAIRLWLVGGVYLIVRKSRAGWFPHFLWCADLANTKVLHFSQHRSKTRDRWMRDWNGAVGPSKAKTRRT